MNSIRLRHASRHGSVLATEVRNAGAEIRQALRQDITSTGIRPRQSAEEIPRAQSGPVSYWWLSAGLIAGLALFVIGILVGRVGGDFCKPVSGTLFSATFSRGAWSANEPHELFLWLPKDGPAMVSLLPVRASQPIVSALAS
jgi:hypothetical protein